MKKVFIALLLTCLFSTGYAQEAVETRVADLEKKVEEMSTRIDGMSQRLAEVEQLNIRLRKALDFGKPITTIESPKGLVYNILSIEGNRKEKTITFKMQVITKNDQNNVAMHYGSITPSIIDINGNRIISQVAEIGNTTYLDIYKDVPVNAIVIFKEVEPDSVVDIKLFKIVASINHDEDVLLFKNLKVEWK